MDDKISHMTELQQQILQQLNSALGMKIKSLERACRF